MDQKASQTPLTASQLFTCIFALFGGAAAFWIVCFSLSSYLGRPVLNPKSGERGNVAPAELSPETRNLQERTDSDPADPEKAIAFAEALVEEGLKRSDGGSLIRALQVYGRVLDKRPEDPRALLGLAHLSFESGVLDKAKQYYDRYLKVVPNDPKARTDLALIRLQMGEPAAARDDLAALAAENPKFFPAKLSLALAQKMSGDREGARKSAQEAFALAPDEAGKRVVEEFLTNVDKPESEPVEAPRPVSPAAGVDQFFRKHPILGPKIASIQWPRAEIVEVSLNEFPMDQMPQFARQKFLASLDAMLTSLRTPVKLRLIDSATQELILERSSPVPAPGTP